MLIMVIAIAWTVTKSYNNEGGKEGEDVYMRLSFTQWADKRYRQDLKCRHVKTMKCIVLTDDSKCRACYEEDVPGPGHARPYMYGRLYTKSRTPAVMHMVKTTGRTLCGLHGRYINYMVKPDGPVCLSCLDSLQSYRDLKARNNEHAVDPGRPAELNQ